MLEVCKGYRLVLGSASPRRKQLLEGAGLDFCIRVSEADEQWPEDLPIENVPEFLSQLKASSIKSTLANDELLITADTIVAIHNKVVGKPHSRQDAIDILSELSGNKHTVITGVTITSLEKSVSFSVSSDVYFRDLAQDEIEYYVDTYKPFDKAGAYGIQEWIGYVGIERIDGSFYNVMGLPIQALYSKLKEFHK